MSHRGIKYEVFKAVRGPPDIGIKIHGHNLKYITTAVVLRHLQQPFITGEFSHSPVKEIYTLARE